MSTRYWADLDEVNFWSDPEEEEEIEEGWTEKEEQLYSEYCKHQEEMQEREHEYRMALMAEQEKFFKENPDWEDEHERDY